MTFNIDIKERDGDGCENEADFVHLAHLTDCGVLTLDMCGVTRAQEKMCVCVRPLRCSVYTLTVAFR